jgi:hypothetical protein
MLFYSGIFGISAVLAFIYTNTKHRIVAMIPLILLFAVLFFVSALRYDTGTDYWSYINFFYTSGKVDSYIEPGYTRLCVFLRDIGLDAQWVLAVMSFLTLFFLFLSVPKKSFYIIIPLYITFLYRVSFNAVRNSLTTIMSYYAYTLFQKGKIFRSIVIILIAMQFHRSAGIMLILFVILHFAKIRRLQSIIVAGLLFCLIPVLDTLVMFLLTGGLLPARFGGLGMAMYTMQGEIIRGIGVYSRFMWYFIMLLFLKDIPTSSDNKTVFNIRILLLVLMLVDIFASFSLSIMYRVTISLIFIWFISVHYFNVTKFKLRKLLLTTIYIYSFVLFFYETKNGIDGAIPYKSILVQQ